MARYGAATSRFLSVYENFSGKSMSVLLEHNYLFLNRYTIKRNDTVII
ncbi:hypothetical protein AD01_0508 [Escherichia coli 2-427-07_S4_C2]|uniref:Uncharacterized protein n=3 Tax=Escherichia coli TaxID=562 RepID=C4TIE7_ECO57|nr:hypothetical protein HMPREF9530_00230 [Escherichia coli MS 21-1]KDY48140.1 hypothetical protein AD01_0508 [Escherichia coli 2-427-07_S4_C2]KEJ39069.1 hypothetical protein AB65_2958 [Escherichia coli 2-460-02_S1_C3]KEJ48027.1 hypothetical protein AD31_1856 [Escherichia coli 2-427-07_S4_C3]KEJ63119.1 hypothetical protein AC88_1807 [Escherichia coli 3-267-03_S4_C1]KEN69869.1 hypothetical protein AD40_1902 [Escherichia coli 1-392-07_S4_C3]KEO01612.1 hypothetical protein AC84_1810 [Escherichia 